MPAEPKPKPYAKLRGQLREKGYDQPLYAKKIGRSPDYVNKRMNGHKAWDEDDMYKTMDLIKAPYEELYVYFPPRGIPKKQAPKQATQGPRRLSIVRCNP